VDSFTYRGSIVTKDGGTDEVARSRIRKANGAFIQLYPVWINRNISKRARLRIFNTDVKSVLCTCKTRKVTLKIANRLLVFLNRSLRSIIDIKWPETMPNEDLWKFTKQQPTAIQIKMRKWRWIGHILRKPTGPIEKAVPDWNPQGLRGAAVPKRPGRGRSRKKPWKWGRHGARLKGLLLTGSGGSVAQMPYAPERATGIRWIDLVEGGT
jgi:hypothetical protein